jgi:hypothetical protein
VIAAKEALLDFTDVHATLDAEEPALGAPELSTVDLEHGPGGVYEDKEGQDQEYEAENEDWASWLMDDIRGFIRDVDRGVPGFWRRSNHDNGGNEVRSTKTDGPLHDLSPCRLALRECNGVQLAPVNCGTIGTVQNDGVIVCDCRHLDNGFNIPQFDTRPASDQSYHGAERLGGKRQIKRSSNRSLLFSRDSRAKAWKSMSLRLTGGRSRTGRANEFMLEGPTPPLSTAGGASWCVP